ncbi:hypothetical protein CANMA_002878 [Candida margitis]|uniref:uncharacterized protein n=1 Tax=Candida margitis TaxID=1775924 RepID=UPI002226FB66|nr:uncharacterized protein CANMA_002878 [Candida margitis]KAI5967698.1 hypothetical protein CANMA_002878 [Candida margitis]
MCITIATTDHPDYSFILLSNRDEFFKRPTMPAQFKQVKDHDKVLAPLDLARPEHGTWIGVTTSGKLAVLVNYRDMDTQSTMKQVSRGILPLNYLESTKTDDEWRDSFSINMQNGNNPLDLKSIGGFTLLYGSLKISPGDGIDHLNILSNKGHHGRVFEKNKQSQRLEKHDHISTKSTFGLSNSLYNDPWKKVELGEQMLKELVSRSIGTHLTQEELVEQCFYLLSHDTYNRSIMKQHDFDVKVLELRNSIFIPPLEREGPESNSASIGDYYGTRTQTIILLDKAGNLNYYERNLHSSDVREVDKPLITSSLRIMPFEVLSTEPETRVYHSPPVSPSASNNDILIMIPGNPGLVGYYITYLDYIQKAIPQFEVFGIDYLGFNKLPTTKQQHIYTVEEQINHNYLVIKHKIEQQQQQPTKPSFYFLSHSLGGFITQRTIKKLLEDDDLKGKFQVKFNGMITPTISNIAGSESGTKFTKMINARIPVVGIAMTFGTVFSYIPESAQRYLLKRQWTVPKQVIEEGANHENVGLENSLETTVELINSPSAINQALNMAKDEMNVITTSDEINDWLFTSGSDTFQNWCFFAQQDHWVSNQTRDHLITKYGNVDPGRNKFEICQNVENPIKHAFVLNQSKEFAEITINRICKAMKRWD